MNQRPNRGNSRMRTPAWAQGGGGEQNPQGWFENRGPPIDALGEIQRLCFLLEMERARGFNENQRAAVLERELQNAQIQLQMQKNLKETSINKERETSNQLQVEREKNRALQQELEQIKASYKDLQSKHESGTQLLAGVHIVYDMKTKQDQQIIEDLKAEKDDLQQKMSKKITCLCNTKIELQKQLQPLMRLKAAYGLHSQKTTNNLQIINKLGAERDALQQQLTALQQLHSGCEVSNKRKLENLTAEYEKDIVRLENELYTEVRANLEESKTTHQIISKLESEKDALQQQLAALQPLNSGCEVSKKRKLENRTAELQDGDELLSSKRKRARRQEPSSENVNIPVKTISDPESMNLNHPSEKTL